MNTRILLRYFALVVAILGSFFSVSPVVASTLIIPQEIEHDGLTFTSPLSYADESEAPTLEIRFMRVDEVKPQQEAITEEEPLLVQPSTEKLVLAEEIVLPTPKKQLITPTLTITPTPKAKIIPTTTPTVTAKPTEAPTATPTPVTATTTTPAANLPSYATDGTLSADVLFSMANQKRADAGLPAFEKHPEVCAIAESRKPEIENEIYGNSSIHAGFRNRSLPFRATENMISQNSETAAMNWWMNSSIHRGAILGGAKYACVACQNKTCAMIFSSLDPK